MATQRTRLGALDVREAASSDLERIWELMLEPAIRAGDAFQLPSDAPKEEGLTSFWAGSGHSVFIAQLVSDEGSSSDAPVGKAVASYLLAQGRGQGGHVASCAMIWDPSATQSSDVDEAILRHALQTAALEGFRSMQFDLVVSTNARLLKLCKGAGFAEVGRLPGAFDHPTDGFVDALILHKALDQNDLAGWIRGQRGPISPDRRVLEDDGMQEELERMQDIVKETRASAALPAAQQLPPPDLDAPPGPQLDENGFEEGHWDLADLVNRVAFHLDKVFFNKPTVEDGEMPSYGPT